MYQVGWLQCASGEAEEGERVVMSGRSGPGSSHGQQVQYVSGVDGVIDDLFRREVR